MTSTNARYNIRINGKATIVTLDPRVWTEFKALAAAGDMTLTDAAGMARREHNGSMSEAITAFVQKNTDTPLFTHATRDAWAMAAVEALRPIFKQRGVELPANIRAGIGFMATGMKSKYLGICIHPENSSTGAHEIFLNVMNEDESPRTFFNILTHELCHAVDHAAGNHGHKASFKAIGEAMDLVGKPKHMRGGDAWEAWAAPLCEALGPIPHSAIIAIAKEKKVQVARMLKCECPDCGATWRIARGTVEEIAEIDGFLRCVKPSCKGRIYAEDIIGDQPEETEEKKAKREEGKQGAKAKKEKKQAGKIIGRARTQPFGDGEPRNTAYWLKNLDD